mmetsp:Transcript_7599/g.27739  ORF Transcript_7599/g.27739 Transcript_7599/m.27739 type:complete len:331 (-) Transcript_7599:320-1312(-)
MLRSPAMSAPSTAHVASTFGAACGPTMVALATPGDEGTILSYNAGGIPNVFAFADFPAPASTACSLASCSTIPLRGPSEANRCFSPPGNAATHRSVSLSLVDASFASSARAADAVAPFIANEFTTLLGSKPSASISTFTALGCDNALRSRRTVPDARPSPPASGDASASCNVSFCVHVSTVNTARASFTAKQSYAPTAPSAAPARIASSASAASDPGSARVRSSGSGGIVSTFPVNIGKSSGPPTYRLPRSAPATGLGGGRTPRVSRSACASTLWTCAEILYSPLSPDPDCTTSGLGASMPFSRSSRSFAMSFSPGHKSKSPDAVSGTAP